MIIAAVDAVVFAKACSSRPPRTTTPTFAHPSMPSHSRR